MRQIKNKKTKIITVGGIVVLLLIIFFVLPTIIVKAFLKPKLVGQINNNKNINLAIDNISYNLFSNSFHSERNYFNLIDSTSESFDSISVKANEIIVSGINWFKYFFNDEFSINDIEINKPGIKIWESSYKNKNKSSNNQHAELILNKRLPFKCRQLVINDGSYIRKNSDSIVKDSIGKFDIKLSRINLAPSNKDSNICESYSCDIRNIYKHFIDNPYTLKINSVSASSSNSLLKIDSIDFQPYLSDKRFLNKDKYRLDRYIVKIKKLEANEFNFNELLNNENLLAHKIMVDDFYLNILTPKYKPIHPNYYPKMPHEIFKSLKVKIDVKKLLMNSGKIVIESAYKYSNKYARLVFTNINADLKNISNIKKNKYANDTCSIFVSTNLADAGRLIVKMELPLLAKDFSLHYSGALSRMDAAPLNSQLIIANLIKIESCRIDTIYFNVNIKNGLSSADLTAIYKDLKVKAVNKKSLNIESPLETFISNNFVLKESNPENGKEDKGTFYYSKKNDDAFLDIIWLSVKGALGSIVGYAM